MMHDLAQQKLNLDFQTGWFQSGCSKIIFVNFKDNQKDEKSNEYLWILDNVC